MDLDLIRVLVFGVVGLLCTVFYRKYAGPAEPKAGRRGRAEAAGFVPRERLNTLHAAPEPALDHALLATGRGDWGPAARLLAETRERRDWGARGRVLGGLVSHRALEPDGWLRAWEAQAGADHPDVALVRAAAVVDLAWHHRGGGWAKDTGPDRFAGFFAALAQAPAHHAAARAANPGDPTPFVAELATAMGTNAPYEEARALFEGAVARDPHHLGAHAAFLTYLLPRWHGSREQARSFAREAAAAAPPGALLARLPLLAWYLTGGEEAKTAVHRTPELRALVDAAGADLAAAVPGSPGTASMHHLLAYFLTRQGRYEEAVAHFRRVDGFVAAAPWTSWTDPAAAYCHWREKAVRGAGRR
ncbi:hypothetical protein ACN20G_30100 (plasmid) [Streptomyces sp. BI20]|uniref:hypothetical protein n=1 Tax=Streptomyces sp. BI20 TaxID=3403460 RepID=UPI003C747C7F